MQSFLTHKGLVAVLDRINVDTDQIIPKQFLKRIERTGFGQFLFYDWRFLEDGSLNPEFELCQDRFQGSTILLAGSNFGCGSSREHAPWALQDYGFRVLIAPSFADIFFNNCFKNGVLPLILPEEQVREILDHATANPGVKLTVDLEAQRVWFEDEEISISFEIDASRRHALLNGLDNIGLTLEHDDKIAAFEASHRP